MVKCRTYSKYTQTCRHFVFARDVVLCTHTFSRLPLAQQKPADIIITRTKQTQQHEANGKACMPRRGSGGASILSGAGVLAARRWVPPMIRDAAHISMHLGTVERTRSPGSRGRKATGGRRSRFLSGPVLLLAYLGFLGRSYMYDAKPHKKLNWRAKEVKSGEARGGNKRDVALPLPPPLSFWFACSAACCKSLECWRRLSLHLQSTRACGSFYL